MTDPLCHFVRQHPRLFFLSGAGVSTPSRIPDYRDEQGRWKRNPPVNGEGRQYRRYQVRSTHFHCGGGGSGAQRYEAADWPGSRFPRAYMHCS